MSRRLTDQAGVSEHAGFPNAATDTSLAALDLNQLLIRHSVSTYLLRLRGNQWENVGIFDGDILIVDRALDPRRSDLVVWWHENSFAVSHFQHTPATAVFWGVVTTIIHQTRRSS